MSILDGTSLCGMIFLCNIVKCTLWDPTHSQVLVWGLTFKSLLKHLHHLAWLQTWWRGRRAFNLPSHAIVARSNIHHRGGGEAVCPFLYRPFPGYVKPEEGTIPPLPQLFLMAKTCLRGKHEAPPSHSIWGHTRQWRHLEGFYKGRDIHSLCVFHSLSLYPLGTFPGWHNREYSLK